MTTTPTRETFRALWAANLAAAQGDMTDVDLAARVTDLIKPLSVTDRSFAHYKTGYRLPDNPLIMWAIARVLGVPGRDLFPLDLDLEVGA
jgi:hypothetical protein